MNDLKTEIKNLEKRIEDLRQIQNADMGASFKEAVQTEEMIDVAQHRLNDLKEKHESSNGQSNLVKSYNLDSLDGKKLLVQIVNSNPDPSKNIFSAESPIGQKILKAKPGDSVNIRNTDYLVR